MYQMLRNIATELEDELDVSCNVFPYKKAVMEPQITLIPTGTSLYLRGKGNSAENNDDAEVFYTFRLELNALGNSEELLESFYEADEKCDKLFSKRLGMMIVNSKPSCTVEFKKKVNGGIYGEPLAEQETGNAVYVFTELWECVVKYLSYV